MAIHAAFGTSYAILTDRERIATDGDDLRRQVTQEAGRDVSAWRMGTCRIDVEQVVTKGFRVVVNGQGRSVFEHHKPAVESRSRW